MKSKNYMIFILLAVLGLIIIGCSQNVQKDPDKGEELVETGSISISSTPVNSQVYLDEEYKGSTPITLYSIPAGLHNLVIRKEGYSDYQTAVNVKFGLAQEIDTTLTLIRKIEKEKEEVITTVKDITTTTILKIELNKINLSSFAMYYDFDKTLFTDSVTGGSVLFSKKYETYIHFTAFSGTKISVINKPIMEVARDDCVTVESVVLQLNSGQTLCVRTIDNSVIALTSKWEKTPKEIVWKLLD